MRVATLTSVLVLASYSSVPDASAQTTDILIDGLFDDWVDKEPHYVDPQDQAGRGIDFERLWIHHDDRYLYFSVVVGVDEISLQNESSITLFLDTDNDALTGESLGGIGADLVWVFGDLGGVFYGDATVSVKHRDIGLIPAPTVTSNRFEFALELDAEPRRQGPLFPRDTLAVAVAATSGGDVIPDPGERIEFVIDRSAPSRDYEYELDREVSTDLRIAAWNVERDGFFEPSLSDEFAGLLNAIDPDIIGFSEIYDHTAGQTIDRLETMLPSEDGTRWFGAGSTFDIVLASRYPILHSFRSLANGSAGAYLLDLSRRGGAEILVIVAHLRCCEADYQRQLQIDEIMAFVRDSKEDGLLPVNTPIVVMGDMNFVGDSRQLATLTNGVIINPTFLPSFEPDWDGSPFDDVIAKTTGVPAAYTWPGRTSDFSPGRLDFIVYSDYVLDAGRAFSLSTVTIPLHELQRLGLGATYSIRASDHQPVVADFRGASVTAVERHSPDRLRSGNRLAVFPNPASEWLTVELGSGLNGPGSIWLVDLLGRKLAERRVPSPVEGTLIRIPVGDLAPGLYAVQFGTASGSQFGIAPVIIR